MKQRSKITNYVSICVILALVFLCSFNVVYSYFSATAEKKGELTFGNLDVKFSYILEGASTPVVIDDKEFVVIPQDTYITRGGTIKFKTSDDENISNLNFYTSADSCACYVRFRVNAYKTDDDSVNFGQYFELQVNSSFVSKKTLTVDGETNTIYYMNDALNAGLNYNFANQMQLSWSAPLELLHSSYNVSISFEAVQSANGAGKLAFNDGWGYLESWS